MAAGSAGGGLSRPQLLADLTGMLGAVTGEGPDWTAAVTEASRLEADLQLESIEVTSLASALADAYGGRVDLMAYLHGLDIDQLLDLTLGDVAALVEASGAA